ncbi:hypothetical protein, partial [Clostridium butyricum]|uniref:hypothetical protein n=1 Tax=Clostridium butyricum TaxID=1492 RepID=UPI00210529F5
NALVDGKVIVKNLTKNVEFEAIADLTEKEIAVIKAGGFNGVYTTYLTLRFLTKNLLFKP